MTSTQARSRKKADNHRNLRFVIEENDRGVSGTILVEDNDGREYASIRWGEGSPLGHGPAIEIARKLAEASR